MTTITVTRDELTRAFPSQPRLVLAFEQLFRTAVETGNAVTANVDSTTGLQNATVITLSFNDAFPNERVLAIGEGLSINDGGAGGNVTLDTASSIATQGGYNLTFNLQSDTNIDLPSSGRMATLKISDAVYASDSAAASGGVLVNNAYRRSDGVVAWRQT